MLTLFRGAGATGQVFSLAHGKVKDRGIGWSGFVAPWTTLAVVPTTPRIVSFSIEAYTQDMQKITILGSLQVQLHPSVAIKTFDLTVDTRRGTHLDRWETVLQALLVEHLHQPIRSKAHEVTTEEAVTANRQFQDAVTHAIVGPDSPLAPLGIAKRLMK